jgi:hypothetical protein
MKAKTLLMLALGAMLTTAIVNQANAKDEPAIAPENAKPKAEFSVEKNIEAEANLSVLVFAKTKPQGVFQYVRSTMADLMEVYSGKGLYIEIEESYALAVYLHYDVTANNYEWLGLRYEDYELLKNFPRPPKHSYFPPRPLLTEM